MARKNDPERADAIRQLKKILRPGDTVYGIVRSVSRSGMSRRIDFYAFRPRQKYRDGTYKIDRRDAEPVYLSGYMGHALGLSRGNGDGLMIGGCGMDMVFSTVYNLGRTLWPKGTRKPHGTRNGAPDTDGGYALKHSAL